VSSASILVGCGGSGIRTLMRLNGLMAEDPFWRARISRDIYYVLLDTELKMIDDFQAAVERQLRGVDKPLIWPLRIAQSHVILQPLVRRYFVEPFAGDSAAAGKERLYEHWWNHPQHGPFAAPKVKPLTQGAGQCPAASYFLTWHYLRSQIEDTFDRLLQELIARRSRDGQDPLAQLNFCIIAGLAGGTGRGSWQLIAFKVREMLLARQQIPGNPVAYLFDASVFENVYRRYPRQEVPMKVNSLAGASELSCWMKNLRPDNTTPFLYQLPAMDSPADPQMDVLSVDLTLDPNSPAPVDNAYLIFGGHERAVLNDNAQYHDMVGTGLFAGLTRAAILSSRINENVPYRSLGTATFEVNSSTLRTYFEGLGRIHVLKRLSQADDAAVDSAVEQFLRACHLRIGITAEKRGAFKADEKGSLLQRACHHLEQSAPVQFDLAGLKQALADDEPTAVQHAVSLLLEPRELLAEQAIRTAVEDLPMQPEDVAGKLVGELLRDTRSVENVRRFVERITAQLDFELGVLPAPDRMQMSREEEPLQLVEEYKSREYFGLIGRHFNEVECSDLQDQTRRGVLFANYRVLCDKLRGQYKLWKDLIGRWKTSSDVILATADRLMAKFKNELQDDLGTSGSDASDFFDALFADAECPERAVPDEFAKARFYRRELKPVLHRGDEVKLLGEPEFKQELAEVVTRSVLNTGLNREAFDQMEKLRRDLEAAVRRTVHLPLRFIEQHFSIRKVVSGLKQAWLRRFAHTRGMANELRELVDRFHSFFGVRPKLDGEDFTLPMDDEFILEMGTSLAATCRPYWRLRNAGDAREGRVTLFLPMLSGKFDKESAEKFVHDRLQLANVAIEAFAEEERPDELGDKPANPFILLAYSVEGTEDVADIASLDYWKSPVVKNLLLRCEDSTGLAMFEQSGQHNGVSYTDPLFIRSGRVRDKRWKPWIDQDVGGIVRDNEVRDALLYALLEPGDVLKERLAAIGWAVPLIRNRGQQWYEFTRRALIWTDAQSREDTACPWRAKTRVAQGIRQVSDVLAGTGRKDGKLKEDGPRWADRIRQEARAFWHEVLPAVDFLKGSQAYKQLLDGVESQLDQEIQQIADDDPDAALWKGLLQRLKDLRQREEL